MGRAMDVCCILFYNKYPGTKPAPLLMDPTQPKTPLPHLPHLPPANAPTLVKQCSMWRRATCVLMDFPQETQKTCRLTLFLSCLLLCIGQ